MVQPKIIGESVELHPLVIILALLIGGSVSGVYGMIFAVPVAAVLKVLFIELYNVFYEGRSGFLMKKNKPYRKKKNYYKKNNYSHTKKSDTKSDTKKDIKKVST